MNTCTCVVFKEIPAGFKPVWSVALGMLAFVGPIYYGFVHIPSTMPLSPNERLQQPVVLYSVSENAESQNFVQSLTLEGLKYGVENTIHAEVIVDTVRFDHVYFTLHASSQGYIKRHLINQNHTVEVIHKYNRITFPCELPRLRKNTVVKITVTAVDQDGNQSLVMLDKGIHLKDCILME